MTDKNMMFRGKDIRVVTKDTIENIKMIEEDNWLFFADIMCECLKLYKDKHVTKDTELGMEAIKFCEEIISEFE